MGISALCRRYRSKEELLQKLCGDGLATYVAAADDNRDAWTAFTTFMRRVVDAGGTSLTIRLAGTFAPTAELFREAGRADELNRRLVERLREAGVIRPDIEVADLGLIFEQLAALRLGDEERTAQLRRRYLVLFLDALRKPPTATDLPGPPPRPEELAARWRT